jgi:hypothetical protein
MLDHINKKRDALKLRPMLYEPEAAPELAAVAP